MAEIRTTPDPRSYRDRLLADEKRRAAAAARAMGTRLDGSPRQPSGPAPLPAGTAQSRRHVVLCDDELHREISHAARTAGVSVALWLRAAAIEKLARG